MSQIFISYSRNDSEIAEDLVHRLRRSSFRAWRDKSDIKAGSNWQNAIETAIEASSAMIVIVTSASLASEWVQREYTAALNAGIQVIPYLCEGVTPDALPLALQLQSALSHSEPGAFERLLAELPRSAHIHASRVVEQNLVGRRDIIFAEAAEDLPNALKFFLELETQQVPLIGLPLKPTDFCTTYLVGRADDTLEWRPVAQLGLQLTQAYPGPHFPVGIAEHFITPETPDYRLRLLLVRGPLRVDFNEQRATYSAGYGLDPDAPTEWRDVLEAVNVALDIYGKGHDRADLHVFSLAPGVILYRLGEIGREYVRTTLYQRVPDRKAYVAVL